MSAGQNQLGNRGVADREYVGQGGVPRHLALGLRLGLWGAAGGQGLLKPLAQVLGGLNGALSGGDP